MGFDACMACGVWSAAPTPLTKSFRVDLPSVGRMVEHHLRLGVKGLFLAGTNGEGPWMPEAESRVLVREVVKAAAGRLPVAVQVTDNSAARIVLNMRRAAEDGADVAVIAPPYFMVRKTPAAIRDLYVDAIRSSPLPVGIYDRGTLSSVVVPEHVLRTLYAEKNVVMAKDSSSDPRRRAVALAARRRRPGLRLLNGNEFDCVTYLRAGYDGLLLGGGVFNGRLATRIVEAVAQGDIAGAERLQARMSRMMFAVYGGRKIRCWLAGEKRLLVELGVFRTWVNFPGYRLTAACEQAIVRLAAREREILIGAC